MEPKKHSKVDKDYCSTQGIASFCCLHCFEGFSRQTIGSLQKRKKEKILAGVSESANETNGGRLEKNCVLNH